MLYFIMYICYNELTTILKIIKSRSFIGKYMHGGGGDRDTIFCHFYL